MSKLLLILFASFLLFTSCDNSTEPVEKVKMTYKLILMPDNSIRMLNLSTNNINDTNKIKEYLLNKTLKIQIEKENGEKIESNKYMNDNGLIYLTISFDDIYNSKNINYEIKSYIVNNEFIYKIYYTFENQKYIIDNTTDENIKNILITKVQLINYYN